MHLVNLLVEDYIEAASGGAFILLQNHSSPQRLLKNGDYSFCALLPVPKYLCFLLRASASVKAMKRLHWGPRGCCLLPE